MSTEPTILGPGGLTIDEEQFRALVRGESANLELILTGRSTGNKVTIVVPVILADIGWDRMIKALQDAGAFAWPETYQDAVERFRHGILGTRGFWCFPCSRPFDSDADLQDHVRTTQHGP